MNKEARARLEAIVRKWQLDLREFWGVSERASDKNDAPRKSKYDVVASVLAGCIVDINRVLSDPALMPGIVRGCARCGICGAAADKMPGWFVCTKNNSHTALLSNSNGWVNLS